MDNRAEKDSRSAEREADEDDEETRLRERLLARRAKQLKELIAAEPADEEKEEEKRKKSHHHHHKKKKRRHEFVEEAQEEKKPRLSSVASTVSNVNRDQKQEIIDIDPMEEGLNIKPPQAGSASTTPRKMENRREYDGKWYKEREMAHHGRYQPQQPYRRGDQFEDKSRGRAEEGWVSWKKSLQRQDYGRGASASSSGRDLRPSRSPSTKSKDYYKRLPERRISPSSSRYPPTKSVDQRLESQSERRKPEAGQYPTKSDTKRKRSDVESGQKAESTTTASAGLPGTSSMTNISPESTPTMDEIDQMEEDGATGFRCSVENADEGASARPRKISGRKSGSAGRGSSNSMESGERRSEDDKNLEEGTPKEGASELKKIKYSKFESSSSESSGESDVDYAPQDLHPGSESGESDQDEPVKTEEKDAQATTAQADMNVSPVSDFDMEPTLPVYYPALMGCRSVEEFHSLNRIEEGTYGVVYRAKEKRTDEIVALKRLKMEKEKEGFPITSLREINMLLKVGNHPNIVKVREVVVGSNMDKIYLVMDYVEHDLKSLMETMQHPFLIGEVKTLLKQLLSGVKHLHENWILHRDLKTSNLLLSHHGILKIADFGLAREYGSPLKPYTPIVVTLWYRAPELLLGIKEYSTPIDIWSVGCIFAEILTLKPFFTGKSEIEQLNKIFKVLGTPNDTIWPGYSELPGVKRCQFTDVKYNYLRKSFGATLSDKGFSLLNRFLTYDPQRRITAAEALDADWFKEEPRPVRPDLFPTWPAKSEQSKAPKKASSPKPPSGGKQFVQGESDKDYLANLKRGAGGRGQGAVPGFSLKFDAPKF